MPMHLLSLTDGSSVPLDQPIILIGRDEECDIQLESRRVSRKHCCLAVVDDQLVIRDLGSTNGTMVNGERIVDAVLNLGQEFALGDQVYRFLAAPKPDDPKVIPLADAVEKSSASGPSPKQGQAANPPNWSHISAESSGLMGPPIAPP